MITHNLQEKRCYQFDLAEKMNLLKKKKNDVSLKEGGKTVRTASTVLYITKTCHPFTDLPTLKLLMFFRSICQKATLT